MESKTESIKYYLLITLLSSLLFIPFIGNVHLFDWDEINFAESAREMIVTGDYLTVRIGFEPFWEKPPLFIWMQVLSMKIFGINEFAARFPNAICGVITLLTLFTIGRKLYNNLFGLYWVLAYTGSLLPFMYFKSGIIDPWFNLFIFLGIYQFSKLFFVKQNKQNYPVWSGIFIGLAILTKGPVAFLIISLTFFVFLIIKKFKVSIKLVDTLVFLMVMAIIGGSWFILLIIRGESNIVMDFILYQIRLFSTPDAGHGGFLLYHFVVLLLGVSPASILALPQLLKLSKEHDPYYDLNYIFKVLFWVVLVLFSIVTTKILHYSSLCYFPLTYFAAYSLYKVKYDSFKINKWVVNLTLIIIVLWIVFSVLLSLFDNFKQFIINSINITDEFVLACINTSAGWKGYEGLSTFILLIGLFYFILFIRKSKPNIAFVILFFSTSIFLQTLMLLVVPKIEKYSQNSAIELIKDVKDEDAYIITLGYKSYAHLFYGQAKYALPFKTKKEMLIKPIDKKLYAILKIDDKRAYLRKYPNLKIIKEKNGFVLVMRESWVVLDSNQ